MSVIMRSNDAILGLRNDLPTFSFIHEMVYVVLREYYNELKLGEYYNYASSMHVYERHFCMLSKIKEEELINIYCPKMFNSEEVYNLINNKFDNIKKEHEFTRWLLK